MVSSVPPLDRGNLTHTNYQKNENPPATNQACVVFRQCLIKEHTEKADIFNTHSVQNCPPSKYKGQIPATVILGYAIIVGIGTGDSTQRAFM